MPSLSNLDDETTDSTTLLAIFDQLDPARQHTLAAAAAELLDQQEADQR